MLYNLLIICIFTPVLGIVCGYAMLFLENRKKESSRNNLIRDEVTGK